MNTLLATKDQILHYARDHRILVYAAVAVAIFVIIALIRFASARSQGDISLASSFTSPGSATVTPGSATVTPINEAPSTRCTHCGTSISSRLDFCPSCGYAQPMRHTGTAKTPR